MKRTTFIRAALVLLLSGLFLFAEVSAQSAASAPTPPAKVKKSKVLTINEDGKVTTKSWEDSTDTDGDWSDMANKIRDIVRRSMKGNGSFAVTGTNGTFSFAFSDEDGKSKTFSIHLDSAMRGVRKIMRSMPRNMFFFDRDGDHDGFHFMTPAPPHLPRMPRLPRAPMHFSWDDEKEFKSDEARKLDAEADAMQMEAKALRKKAEADAMMKEAEAMKKRAEAIRAEAKTKKKSEDSKSDSKK